MTDLLDWADVAAIGVVARLHYHGDCPRAVQRSLARSRCWDDHRRIVAEALRQAYCGAQSDRAVRFRAFCGPQGICRTCAHWDSRGWGVAACCDFNDTPRPPGGPCHRWVAR